MWVSDCLRSEPWEGILDGTVSGPWPMQPKLLSPVGAVALPDEFNEIHNEYDEDCLYLNVFTPSMNSSDKLPVGSIFVFKTFRFFE